MTKSTLRVLLVDDDEDDFLLTRDLLAEISQPRIQVEWISDGASARARLREGDHDVYLLDYRMGAVSGLDLLREAITGGCSAPIILLTGQEDRAVDHEAMRAGAADYLIKGQITAQLLDRSIRYARERARTLESLRQSEERYALACAAANDGLWDWDLKTNKIYYSPRWKAMLGWGECGIGMAPNEWFDRVHPEDLAYLRRMLDQYLLQRAGHFEAEYRMQHHDRTYRWIATRGLAVEGPAGVVRLVGSQSDITARKNAEAQLLHDAFHDTLTGLPNRALFQDRLGHALQRCHRSGITSFAVLFLDLNRFKIINDSLGHEAGDHLLKETARRLRETIRTCDTVARLGGDEFTVLVEPIDGKQDALQVAERIYRNVAQPITFQGQEIVPTASIGITVGSTNYTRPEEVLRDADIAMYRAKRGCGSPFQVFDTSMNVPALEFLRLESELHTALERGELEVHYQPVVDLETRRIAGVEALVRWRHPDRGLILPGEFIPVAEETGQILPLGLWVMREACLQLSHWRKRSSKLEPLWLSVNVSPRQFGQGDLVQHVHDVLRDTATPPRQLRLEITETTVMQSPEVSLVALEQLHSLGVKLSIDDFGVGHSSLSYLQRFPVDILKVDRSFVSRITSSPKDLELVRIILLLARNLSVRAVAEGVETQEQACRLRELGCHSAQGYLFARPLPGPDALDLLLGWDDVRASDRCA